MFGMRSCGPRDEAFWAGERQGRRRHWGRFGGGRGFGGGDILRAGRMLATGDLRLLALALIAEQPRHGYEIIKVLEDKTEGWYSPSPGIVYPTLTFLEEAGYVTAATAGAKKLYTITDEGRAHLDENRDFVDAVLERLSSVGQKLASMRRRFGGGEREEREGLPRLVRAALENLREVAAKRIEDDPAAETKVVETLARAAGELRKTT